MPSVAIALIEPMLWTRYVSTPDGVQVHHHVDCPVEGDLVAITDVPVIHAIEAGELTLADAEARGFLRLYGKEDAQRILLEVHGSHGSRPLPKIGPGAAGYIPEDLTITWQDLFADTGGGDDRDDRRIRIPGYVLPLASHDGRVIEFLLVPWVGACIHSPAPPAHQIIHVTEPEGIAPRPVFDAVWIEGALRRDPGTHRLFLVDGSADVAADYALRLDSVTAYKETGPSDELARVDPAASQSWWQRQQTRLSMTFTQAIAGIRGGRTLGAFGWALLVCFGYGVLHTLGPGHGKSVVVAYFVGEGGSLRRGVRMGLQIAVFHVLSAVVVVLLTDVAVRAATGGSGLSDYTLVRRISYAVIVGVGVFMLQSAIKNWLRAGKVHDHNHDHDSTGSHGCAACAALPLPGERRGMMTWLSLAVGAVPCTGALLVLLYGVANDALLSAILLVVGISAGMAITLSVIGITAIYGRNLADRKRGADASRGRFAETLQVVGAVVVLSVGVTLFAVSIKAPDSLPGGTVLGQVEQADAVGGRSRGTAHKD
jgi:nickel/cobalt exporter